MRTIGWPIATADNVSTIPALYQRFKISSTENSQIMRGAQVGIIFQGDPAFTAISAEIWSDNGSGPVTKIANSTSSLTKAQVVLVEDHGMKWLGFSFNYIPLRSAVFYNLALRMTGYTGDASAHIAWRISYPDPQYRTGLTITTNNADNVPLEMSIVSGDQ